MYDYGAGRLAPCLELQGLAVPPAPARESFVGALRAGIAWNPYYAADGMPLVASPADLAALDRLDDDTLWRVARSQRIEADVARLEALLERNADDALSAVERLELERSLDLTVDTLLAPAAS